MTAEENKRKLVWALHESRNEKGNPTLQFLREMNWITPGLFMGGALARFKDMEIDPANANNIISAFDHPMAKSFINFKELKKFFGSGVTTEEFLTTVFPDIPKEELTNTAMALNDALDIKPPPERKPENPMLTELRAQVIAER